MNWLEHTKPETLDIAEIDLCDETFLIPNFQDLTPFVTAGVVDQWDTQTFSAGHSHGADDTRHDVGRCDQIDVVATVFLDSQHQLGQV